MPFDKKTKEERRARYRSMGGKWISLYSQQKPICLLGTKLICQRSVAGNFDVSEIIEKDNKFSKRAADYHNKMSKYLSTQLLMFTNSESMAPISRRLCNLNALLHSAKKVISERPDSKELIRISLTNNEILQYVSDHQLSDYLDKPHLSFATAEEYLVKLEKHYEETYRQKFNEKCAEFYNTQDHHNTAGSYLSEYKASSIKTYAVQKNDTKTIVDTIICDNLKFGSAHTICLRNEYWLHTAYTPNLPMAIEMKAAHENLNHFISMMFLNYKGTPTFLLADPNLGTISFTNFLQFKSALNQMINDYIRAFGRPELVIETLVTTKPQQNVILPDLKLPTLQEMKFVTKSASSLFAQITLTPVWFLKIGELLNSFHNELDHWERFKIIMNLYTILDLNKDLITTAIKQKKIDGAVFNKLQTDISDYLHDVKFSSDNVSVRQLNPVST